VSLLQPQLWVYRYFETINGKKSRRKRIVGTVEEYPTRAAAERACEHVRMAANAETTTPESPSLGGLIDRYIEQVLRPCLDVPLGGGQDEFAQIYFRSPNIRYLSLPGLNGPGNPKLSMCQTVDTNSFGAEVLHNVWSGS
jgi:hypothetical protein